MFHNIFVLDVHDVAALASTTNLSEGSWRHTFDVAVLSKSYNYIFFLHQVFDIELFGNRSGNLSSACISKSCLDVNKFVFDNFINLGVRSEDFLQLSNQGQGFMVFSHDLVTFQTCQSLQSHIENSLSLFFGKCEIIHQALFGFIRVF